MENPDIDDHNAILNSVRMNKGTLNQVISIINGKKQDTDDNGGSEAKISSGIAIAHQVGYCSRCLI
jgi:hypothetical protein